MERGREQIIGDILDCVGAIGEAIGRTTTREFVGLDLTMAQLKALIVLADGESMPVGVLGQRLRIQLPAASHTVDSLVQIRLATRSEDPEDRRRTLVRLTPDARALVEKLRQGRQDLFRGLLEEVDGNDLEVLLRGIQAVAEVARRRLEDKADPECSTGARRIP